MSFSNYISYLPFLLLPVLFTEGVAATLAEEEVRFIVIGDWGRKGRFYQKEIARVMIRRAKEHNIRFIISTGDNFYNSGVKSVSDPQWVQSFEAVYPETLLPQCWYPVLGNHDYRGNPQAEIDYSHQSKRWRMSAHYYTFSIKVDSAPYARFIFIDTPPFISRTYERNEEQRELAVQDTARQKCWLDSVLAGSREKWIIVAGHHPVYSGSPYYGDEPDMIAHINPLLTKYEVDCYFSGHDHSLQHVQAGRSKTDYFISGGGALTHFITGKKQRYPGFRKVVPGIIEVVLKGDTLEAYFINRKGDIIYSMSRKQIIKN